MNIIRAMKRIAYPLFFVSVVAIHLVLVFYFERPSLVFSNEPIAWLDFDTHVGQVWRVAEALDGWGKAWSYDPQLLAGHPSGTIFDVDNKGWELWTYSLWKLGLSKGFAFNMFILLSHLMVPWIIFASARLFDLDRWSSLTAMLLGVALWYFDALAHWCWFVGMVSYGIVGYFFLLPLAIFYRYTRRRKWAYLGFLAISLGAGHLIHPYIFVVLVFPMTAIYVRSFRDLTLEQHIGIVAVALFTIAVNSYWLVTALRFWGYILNSAYYGQSTLSFLLTDYLGLIRAPLVSGVIGNRTGFRFLTLVAAVFCLFLWMKEKDKRFLPFALGLGVMIGITYLGGYLWLFAQIQPYRHILPAMYLAVIPAAVFFTRVVKSGAMRNLPKLVYATGVVVVVVAVSHLARDVLYFVPAILPEPAKLPEANPHLADPVGFGSIGYPKHMEFRHQPVYPDFNDMAQWVEKNDDGHGRILVEWSILGEHLAWRTRSQILGGFLERNIQHSAANLFRRKKSGDLGAKRLKRYLEDYAVKWVILTNPKPEIEKYTNLLKPLGYMPPHHRIYETGIEVSYFAENRGQVRASLNRLDVSGTDPRKDVVLRFHWLDTFVCKEGCTVRREPVEHDPVGFIRVLAPHPPDFTIENGY